jgi:hypothetical protein
MTKTRAEQHVSKEDMGTKETLRRLTSAARFEER